MSIKVLYEDNHIIAVVKPAGVLSQGDKTGDVSLFDEVKKYLKEKYKKPGNVFLGLLHRLDRPASGIMLFAKTSKGASRLSLQFRNHTIVKTYEVLVTGKPKQNKGLLSNLLGKDVKLKKASEYADGAEANLLYEVVKSNGKHSLLKVQIEMGKFHQIRAQLSLAGMPLVGDVKYGGEKWSDQSRTPTAVGGEHTIALCATGLDFQAATEDKLIKLSIDPPVEWATYLSTE